MQLLEVAAPASGLDEMIQMTRADHATLAPLKTHQSHILCFYKGDAADPVLRVQAMFRHAGALVPLGVVGVIQDAWQCFAASALATIADPKHTQDMRDGLAQMALCNLIPFYGKQGTWWASKGHHVFGVPDFALWHDSRFGVKPVQTIFSSLFSYLQGGATILPGHTMELSGVNFVVGKVTEFRDYLCGPGKTIALRPQGSAVGRAANRPRVLMLPLLFGLFLLGMIFKVHPLYVTMKVILGVTGGLSVVFGLLPLWSRSK